jgi:hypothetical protein
MFQCSAELSCNWRLVILLESLFVFADDGVTVATESCPWTELEFKSFAQFPTGKIHCLVGGIVQLNPLQIGNVIRRMIKNFVDNYLAMGRQNQQHEPNKKAKDFHMSLNHRRIVSAFDNYDARLTTFVPLQSAGTVPKGLHGDIVGQNTPTTRTNGSSRASGKQAIQAGFCTFPI